MAKWLADIDQVAHYWANKVQDEGRSKNVFFEGDRIYSYGRHFCMGRHLPGDTVALSTQTYSSSTSRQQSKVRAAVRHLRVVYCYDPDASAAYNQQQTILAIEGKNVAAAAPRIRQATRETLKADAVGLAVQFNEYLRALPAEERGNVQPFKIDGELLDTIERQRVQRNVQEAERRRQDEEARKVALADAVAAWRRGEYVRHNLLGLPVMLRLVRFKGSHRGGLLREGNEDYIETSHGAEVPAKSVAYLWHAVQQARAGGVQLDAATLAKAATRLGVYELRFIRADGSIVVGCHDIPYAELERMAVELGMHTAETTAA